MPEGINVDPQIVADCGPFIFAAFVVFVAISLVVVTMEHRVILLALHEGLGFCMISLYVVNPRFSIDMEVRVGRI